MVSLLTFDFFMPSRLYLALIIASLTLGSAGAAHGIGDDSDDAPSFFRIYSQNGNEVFQAECHSLDTDRIKCDFIGLRMTPPDLRVLSKQEKDFEKAKLMPSDSEKKVAAEPLKALSAEEKQKLQEKLDSPDTGPKTKKLFRDMMLAYSERDGESLFRLFIENQKRTCQAVRTNILS